ncbi:ATP-binding protein [Granulosicoccus sp.]|nr:AAA family ATPase [Granulosicoccus sp.]MDB4224693.1 ATP-binding protein [Granulosicoccus sp.]
MKLEQIKIKNYRSYREEISIPFDDLTALVAKNDVGKSSILEALDAFFNAEKLEVGDRSSGLGNAEKIELTCVFSDIPDQLIIDTDNLISPANEYLLNTDVYANPKARVFAAELI